MVDATHTSYPADDRSYYSLLKKDIHHKAQEASFDAKKLAALDLVLAEMTSNLHKYATGGEILAGLLHDQYGEYLEIICIDNGPGMADVAKVMIDGYSTTNTMGNGLGSMKRLSDRFDVFSIKGWGTIILSRIYKNELKTPIAAIRYPEIRPLVVAKTGEVVSGDGIYCSASGKIVHLMVADGLGHGKEANLAINEAANAFRSSPFSSPVERLRYLHQSIRKTRGMVGIVAAINMDTKSIEIAGIGNVAAKFLNFGGLVKNHISYNGIIGHNIPNTMNDQQVSIADYNLLIFCSDGIKSRWDISKYQGVHKCDPALLAAAIYKDFSRRTDDTSVIVVKLR
ncbi:SpoIIE family protein phosphatase [Mucilaginibacter sp. Bleaf8]|uniref:SpoIIE family protein phosphatase n=1 Tax=Mucilaginibacter sp. Bleaf8 TaxID=2834430 RepID=UPI001BCBFC0D|nr:SpoIIE family protein phosphatase [Mucilaginibacter sp. Bleaf8]MBS7564433.1 SpoIIE family protein phosphatase [Mucilaginibacter sp. Bleaf8]